jgi:hypothetical protein
LAVIVSQTAKKLRLRKKNEMEQKKIYGYFIVTLFAFFLFYKPIFCFLILGILLMYYSVNSLIFFDYINKKGIKTNGKILSYEKDEDSHKTPIIEFKTLEGNLITKKPHYYASTDLSIVKTYQNNINKNIEILYSPKNPELFIMEKEKKFNYGSVIFMIFGGLIFSGIAIGQIFGIIKIDM